jgi:predicted nucleotidyltransferase
MRESAMPSHEESKAAGKIEFYGGYEVYDENGVDLTLLRDNLKRSLEKRMENNVRGVRLANAMQEAGRRLRQSSPDVERKDIVIDASPILQQLAAHQVEFVVIGGLAMRIHGSAHITDDLDVCYRRTPANLQAVAAAFAPLHPYLRGAPAGLPFRFEARTIQAGLNFTLTTDHGPVDLLGEVSGVGDYDQALSRSVEADMFGLKVRVLSLDGLIAAKKAAGRTKDRLHLLELEALKKLRDVASPL